MTKESLEDERKRFNSIDPVEAKRLLESVEGKQPPFSSCWYCNGAHEHLREWDLFLCFACGIHYVSGYPVAALYRRAKGEKVTEEDMAHFNAALEGANE